MARRSNSGLTLIEVLISVLILVVSLMAMIGLWRVNMKLTEKHGDMTQAYNLGREMMERAKLQGFKNVPEGDTIIFFDADGGHESLIQEDVHKFRVTMTVISDRLSVNGTTGEVTPSDTAVRDVVVTIVRIPGNVVERTSGTQLVRSGV